ncbi:AAA family ATPase [Pedobacter sp. ASV1-7]|uniref:ATP-dependent nuclease n=1 Tax=Pedobacter sp. ASV1-7 TaxID=3145237 RepID=UPI0032E8FB65
MKLQKVVFKNIRNFTEIAEFDFSDTTNVNTVSGKNGSGKSTIFKCIVLCQKAFFAMQIPDNKLILNSLKNELAKFFTTKNSFIQLSFSIDVEGESMPLIALFKVSCLKFSQSTVDWEIVVSDADKVAICKYWNLNAPKDIIVYIDSNKNFIETDISYDNISITEQIDFSNLLLNTIINPDKIFQNIYTSLIKVYLRERLVPARPRKDLYFIIAKIQLKELLPQIQLSNFSGNQFVNQFVLLGKSSSGRNTSFYDIRNFSSGEKVLFYLLLFINYVQEIGMLVIDEPENHFHEDLLMRFIKMLNDITNTNDYNEYIVKLATKNRILLPKETKAVYKNYNLSQIVLLTHSKNLIYNNLHNESNYYIDNSFKKIGYDDSEKILREIGISSMYSKVLFVEGSTDTDFFDIFFNEYNIKVHPLNGCAQVIDTYKKIMNIKQFLHDSHFCFLIDRDTRTDQEIEKLRSENTTFFDDHFIILDRHEFESYFLDEQIFSDLIIQHEALYPSLIPLRSEDIESKIFDLVSETREQVFKKHLNKLNGNSIGELNNIFRKKSVPVNSPMDYAGFLNETFDENDVSAILRRKFESNYNLCEVIYSDQNWRLKWKTLCDGKTGLSKVTDYFKSHLQITFQRLKIELKGVVVKNRSYEINEIINQIIEKFDVQRQ